MRSKARQECDAAVEQFREYIATKKEKGQLLYVGTAGDPTPKGEYSAYFPTFDVTSVDADPKWGSDLVFDIASPPEGVGLFDLIIMTQVIEHIPNFFDVPNAMLKLTSVGAYIIIDCPWSYPYHPEPPSFGDYWRISKDGFKFLFNDSLFEFIDIIQGEQNTSCLIKRV